MASSSAKEVELVKLLSAAITASTKAEDGDAAELQRAVDALKQLAKQPVTADVLAKTEAGKKVKKLCKHNSSAIKDAANAVIDAWKTAVRNEQAKGNTAQPAVSKADTPALESQEEPSTSGGLARPGSTGGLSSQGSLGRGNSDAAAPKLTSYPKHCGDSTRDKIRDLLAEALNLAAADGVPGDPCAAAVEVEEAMHKQNGGVNQKYKSKYRSLAFNLKDPSNPELRGKVLLGQVTASVLVNMTAEELASSDRRQDNDKIREYKKMEAVRGNNNTASTDMFQCGKCRQRKCTYYQLQTRSADEPMTTFVTCTNCGNRWKFC